SLTANNTYSGATLVNAGVLLINGDTGNSDVTVNIGATLGGVGITGDVLVQPGGFLAPGDSTGPVTTGTLTTGNLTLTPFSTLVLEIDGPIPDTQFDVVNVTGLFSIDDDTSVVVELGFEPALGEEFVVVPNTGLQFAPPTTILSTGA